MYGDVQQYISADNMIGEIGADPKDDEHILVEFLQSVNSSSLPPGELTLKVGYPTIFLHDLLPSQGLCNRTCMIMTRMHDRVLKVHLTGGEHDGEIGLIPHIWKGISAG
jgi:hypothetical protein